MTTSPNARRSRFRPTHALGTYAVLSLAGLIATPAGAVTKPQGATPTKPAVKTTSKVVPTTFPSVKVIDLATSKSMDLATFNVTTKPQLVWIWSPS